MQAMKEKVKYGGNHSEKTLATVVTVDHKHLDLFDLAAFISEHLHVSSNSSLSATINRINTASVSFRDATCEFLLLNIHNCASFA